MGVPTDRTCIKHPSPIWMGAQTVDEDNTSLNQSLYKREKLDNILNLRLRTQWRLPPHIDTLYLCISA